MQLDKVKNYEQVKGIINKVVKKRKIKAEFQKCYRSARTKTEPQIYDTQKQSRKDPFNEKSVRHQLSSENIVLDKDIQKKKSMRNSTDFNFNSNQSFEKNAQQFIRRSWDNTLKNDLIKLKSTKEESIDKFVWPISDKKKPNVGKISADNVKTNDVEKFTKELRKVIKKVQS